MNILITGGCGFIGSHLAQYYLEKGHKVVCIDNLDTGKIENISEFQQHQSFTFEEADLLTWPNLQDTVSWADVIFHLAASVGMFKVLHDPIAVINNNIIACNHLLQAIANAQKKPITVIVSSSAVYGDSKGLCESSSLNLKPLTNSHMTYSISKLSEEVIGYAHFYQKNIPVILPRIFNTIGPRQTGQYGMVVPRFIRQACENEPLTVFGDGHQTRSFCDVRDVVAALDLLINTPASIGKSINIGNNREISINNLAELTKSYSKSNSEIVHIPYDEAYGVDYVDIEQRCPNLNTLFALTSFQHQWTLEDTLKDLITKYKQSQNNGWDHRVS
ncbi:NAD-dependent epimerase/dehydratase family protein [Legionella birminghamensis]|uniref:NAD-dependent epimerase/dehydratase family protein n=1 Tax=Legionella birminghamensis TaxID=28083 RepID=UPI0010414D88|nr:NAD-dependent epimerase/dehydratase family protein [Legionella birminghamensis]